MEKTLVIIKPDGVRRRLVGDIIARYEKKEINISRAKLMKADRNILENHYMEHRGKEFYDELINYMQEGPIMVMVLEGDDVIELVRMINGDKDPKKALPGTIRGDFANSMTQNIVHGSDSKESAEREIKVWFSEES